MKHPLLAILSAAVTVITSAGAALAQYEPVEGQVRESIPAGPYLAGAYGFIWVAVLIYVVTVVRRQRRIEGEIEELRRKLGPGA